MIHGNRSSYTTDTCNELSGLKDYATAVIRINPSGEAKISYETAIGQVFLDSNNYTVMPFSDYNR
jgi:hypothetical protein